MKEIERKFLISALPGNLPEGEEIEQTYLGFEPEKRIRRKGKRFFYTEKEGHGLVRKEREREIDAGEYRRLAECKVGNTICKTRYLIPVGEHTCELDIYGGKLAGLTVAEVEFETVDQAERFTPPFWFGEEITGNKKYSNCYLSMFDIVEK